jgi:hypothetical protein
MSTYSQKVVALLSLLFLPVLSPQKDKKRSLFSCVYVKCLYVVVCVCVYVSFSAGFFSSAVPFFFFGSPAVVHCSCYSLSPFPSHDCTLLSSRPLFFFCVCVFSYIYMYTHIQRDTHTINRATLPIFSPLFFSLHTLNVALPWTEVLFDSIPSSRLWEGSEFVPLLHFLWLFLCVW